VERWNNRLTLRHIYISGAVDPTRTDCLRGQRGQFSFERGAFARTHLNPIGMTSGEICDVLVILNVLRTLAEEKERVGRTMCHCATKQRRQCRARNGFLIHDRKYVCFSQHNHGYQVLV